MRSSTKRSRQRGEPDFDGLTAAIEESYEADGNATADDESLHSFIVEVSAGSRAEQFQTRDAELFANSLDGWEVAGDDLVHRILPRFGLHRGKHHVYLRTLTHGISCLSR